jgi:hypothetical protein
MVRRFHFLEFLGTSCNVSRRTCILALQLSLSLSEVVNLIFAYINPKVGFREHEAPLPGGRAVMRSVDYQRMARLGTGALLLLLVHGFYAPRSALAGCNHLVTSRIAQGQLPSWIEPLILDLAGQPNQPSVPTSPRPCLGRWCSGQPATPPIPPEVFDHGQLDSWAWCSSIPGSDSAASAFLSSETNAFRPVQAGNEVFHPPRLFLPA